ncbi:sirohydrochlorin chelatase [Alteribacter populi]|uniref:sirohydrochlorin chelatase n=1 Tax=Alteribacter populi TaxID=2011011 RepID=UPI000BBB5BCB|nr:CbiX/SirB N-terminal domain-containing protein [Alteribacter populi]
MRRDRPGVLVIVHGSSNPNWVKKVKVAIHQVDSQLPITLGYLEFTEDETIEQGIRTLENQGCGTILAIPLFVSSGSTHIEEIKYVLGLLNTPLIKTDLSQITTSARIRWLDPMDAHPLIIAIIMDRIKALSVNPEKEVLLFVAHGSEEPFFHQRWEKLLEDLKEKVVQKIPLYQICHGTLHPDNIKERATEAATSDRTMIVVPLFLSEGYFTNKVIPNRLKGLSYKWSGDTYLPHPLISKWLEEKIATALSL